MLYEAVCVHGIYYDLETLSSDLTRMFHKRSAARPENTMPAALQRKKDSSKYFNMSAVLFTLFLAFMAFSGLARRPL